MVFFTCDNCGEAQKKNQIDKHLSRCFSSSFSCIDCNRVFSSSDYKLHVKCITEDQKYGGKDFVSKANKGEVKQNTWVDQVEKAIEKVDDSQLKSVLEKIKGYGNIPRKEAKFVNFLKNSLCIHNRNLCLKVWKAIENSATSLEDLTKNGQLKPEDSTKIGQLKSEIDTKKRKQDEKNESELKKAKIIPFKWKSTIKKTLKTTETGQMSVKKLEKAVISYYRNSLNEQIDLDEEKTSDIFREKLARISNVTIEGKMAKFIS